MGNQKRNQRFDYGITQTIMISEFLAETACLMSLDHNKNHQTPRQWPLLPQKRELSPPNRVTEACTVYTQAIGMYKFVKHCKSKLDNVLICMNQLYNYFRSLVYAKKQHQKKDCIVSKITTFGNFGIDIPKWPKMADLADEIKKARSKFNPDWIMP